jgi:hypothetical protein
MRRPQVGLVVSLTAFALSVAGPAAAQEEWQEYTTREDGFSVLFPGQPRIEETTWLSQMEYKLPARFYRVDKGREHYSVTVADYRGLEQLGIERSKACPPGNAQCRQNAGIMGPGYWRHDARGAVMFATSRLVKRDGAKVTGLGWEWQEMVEGNFVQLTNADGSRTFAWVTMHENKLYILEGTVPGGSPEPGLFQQSWSFVDANGRIRYQEIVYSNAYHGLGAYPKPANGAQGRGRGAGAAGAGAGAGAPARGAGPGRGAGQGRGGQ